MGIHSRPTQDDPYGSKLYSEGGKELTEWAPITEDNINELREFDVIKFHDGYGWVVKALTPFFIQRGFVPTGIHNEVATFLNPAFGEHVFVLKD